MCIYVCVLVLGLFLVGVGWVGCRLDNLSRGIPLDLDRPGDPC